VVAFAAGLAGLLTADTPNAKAANTINAYMGGGANGVSVELFLPTSITVQQGDTITWTNPYIEPHTLTYLTGGATFEFDEVANVSAAAAFNGTKAFSSGFVVEGGSFSVTFTTQGAFKFICLIHPGMAVDVSVMAPGSYVPVVSGSDPGNKAIAANALALGEAASAAVKVPAATKNANGSSTYKVLTGPSLSYFGGTIDLMRFYNARTSIAVGDTVSFEAPNPVPHTVTFFPPSGPPAEINPFAPVVPSPNFDGSAYVNSGIISTAAEFGGVSKFSLTFTKAGTYSYICLLHADQGMAGVIVVGSGTSGGVTPPNTGDAGLQNVGSSSSWMIYSGLALLAASAVAGFVVARR
jgi:plastocyanin